MKKIVNMIVEKRVTILVLMVILTIGCAFLMTKVNQNNDMTKYLPDDSSMKIGIDLMEKEFVESDTDSKKASFKMMFKGLADADKTAIASEISGNDRVVRVDFELGNDAYNRGEYTLYIIHVGPNQHADEAKALVKELTNQYNEEYEVYTSGEIIESDFDELPLWIVGLAVLILMIILFMMCASWFEPILFLVTILMAIVINMGTNAFLDSVSVMTYSIAAILQLGLSMDYSIILIDRYRQELAKNDSNTDAMKNALRHAFAAITSSSVTTIVGLLALVFMSFKIGADMGIVLAKGVFISLICIFTILPGLIIMFDKIIHKTRKKVLEFKLVRIGSFEYKIRYFILIAFVLFFIGSYFTKGSTDIAYTLKTDDKVAEVFPEEQPLVIVYSNEDESGIAALQDKILTNPHVLRLNSYGSTLGKSMTYQEMASNMGMEVFFTELLYYMYLHDSDETDSPKIVFRDLFQFLQTDVAENKEFSAYLSGSDDFMAQMNSAGGTIPEAMLAEELTAESFATMSGIEQSTAEILFDYYFITHGEEPTESIALYDFMNYLTEAAKNGPLSTFFDAATVQQFESAKAEMEEGAKSLVGENYSRLILSTDLTEESKETMEFFDELILLCDNSFTSSYYIVGDSAMSYEMSKNFKSEMNRITILTAVAIFIVVAITFRSLVIPLVLVTVIQTSVYMMMSIIGLQGYSIYYIALLVVQCILMGATIDYGILFTTYYREKRATMDVKEAIIESYHGSMHTILTSASIMVFVTGILAYAFKNPTVGQICQSISRGALVATLLIVFILPGMLGALDRFIKKS